MRSYNFYLSDNEIDEIVVDELKLAYGMNKEHDMDEGGWPIPVDKKLLDSIEVVLKYFTTPDDFEEWKKTSAVTDESS